MERKSTTFIEVVPNLYQYNKDQNGSLFILRVSHELSLRCLLKAELLLGKGQFAVFRSCTRFISKFMCLQLQSLL